MQIAVNAAVISIISLQLPLMAQEQSTGSGPTPSPAVLPTKELAQNPQPKGPTPPNSTQPGSVSPVDPIPPLVAVQRPWPAPNLNPGVPSSFIANWGDVFITGVGTTTGKQRPDADGSWVGGFGLGDATTNVAIEVNGGCGSFKKFCGNGGLGFRIGRVLIEKQTGWLALSGGWQNVVQWGYEGKQDNVYYGGLSYAFPLRPIQSGFGQTLQINAGVGNSYFAPYSATNSEEQIGGFASIGVELLPAVGISAGWSGRGANAQVSYTPFSNTPLTLNLLGVDLFNQTPSGAVAVFAVSWGSNYLTPNFP